MNGVPDFLPIHLKVPMDKPVSHANDFSPGDLGMSFSRLVRYATSGFADDFECLDDSVLMQPTCVELAPCQAGDKKLRIARCDQYVQEIALVARS